MFHQVSVFVKQIMIINDIIDPMFPTEVKFKGFPLFPSSFINTNQLQAENHFKSCFTFHLSIHFQFYEGSESLILIYNYWQNKGRYCSLAVQ